MAENGGFEVARIARYTQRADDTHARTGYRAVVLAVRRLIAQRHLATVLCAAALMLKLLVPAGYMIGNDHGRVAIELCSGLASQPMARTMPGMHGDSSGHGKSQNHDKAEMPCAFSGLSVAALGAIDPIQFAALIVFVMAIGLVPTVLPALTRRGYLRPPLRGPPAAL